MAPKKIYATDLGIRNCVAFRFSEDLGRLAENAVFNLLKMAAYELYYAKGKGEVDFLLKKGTKIAHAIQVCFSDLEVEKIRDREIQGLKEIAKEHRLNSGIIVTDNKAEEMREEGLTIHFVPLIDFLINGIA